MATAVQSKPDTHVEDFLPLKGTDHVEFYVGKAIDIDEKCIIMCGVLN